MCSPSSPSQISLPNINQSPAQEITDFSPLAPDYNLVDAQQVISNLPEIKECEFDHAYILHHLEQLEIDPTLCSKCSVANKYFASPKPFVQDLYKKSCYWERIPGTSNDMNIPPIYRIKQTLLSPRQIGNKTPIKQTPRQCPHQDSLPIPRRKH